MSKFKKIMLITVAVAIALSVILSIFSILGNNPISNITNTVLSPVQSAISNVANPIKDYAVDIFNIKTLKDENERLKNELLLLKKESRNQEEYKKENARLVKLLGLIEELELKKSVAAKIIAFEPDNWFNTLVINKGKNYGIEISDVVITDTGVVGKIIEVGTNWSRVSTVIDPTHSIGVKLTRTGDVGIVEGDTDLLKKRKMKLGYTLKGASVIKGDLLETSGLGGIYPPGLFVGTVEEIEFDNTGEIVKAVVTPSADFENLYEVLVVTDWELKENDGVIATDEPLINDDVTEDMADEDDMDEEREE